MMTDESVQALMDECKLTGRQARRVRLAVNAAVAVMRRAYRPDCCIAATRVLHDLFRGWKVKAEPVACEAVLLNAPGCRWVEEHGRFAVKGDPDDEDSWHAMNCHAVWIGKGDGEQPGRWAGHLVLVAHGTTLIDLTLPQAARPEKGITPVPLVGPVLPGFIDGEGGPEYVTADGQRVVYYARPGDRSYARAKDWSEPARHAAVVRRVREAVEFRMGR